MWCVRFGLLSELTILNMGEGMSCVDYNYDRLEGILQIRVNFACYYRMPMDWNPEACIRLQIYTGPHST